MRSGMKIAVAGMLTATCAASPQMASAIGTTQLGVYEEQVSKSCGAGLSCVLGFSLLNQALIVSKVSCDVVIKTRSPIVDVVQLGEVNSAGTFKAGQSLLPIQFLEEGATSHFQVLASTLQAFKTGTKPAVQIAYVDSQVGAVIMSCTISGK